MILEKAQQFLDELYKEKDKNLSAMDFPEEHEEPRWVSVPMYEVWEEEDLERCLKDDCRYYSSFKEAVEDSQKGHHRFTVIGIYDRESQLPVAMVMTGGVFLMEGTTY